MGAAGPAALFARWSNFLQALELKRTVFRSDHASNWLVLKGTLGAEKDRLLAQVRPAMRRAITSASP
jgi:hypothetical protein